MATLHQHPLYTATSLCVLGCFNVIYYTLSFLGSVFFTLYHYCYVLVKFAFEFVNVLLRSFMIIPLLWIATFKFITKKLYVSASQRHIRSVFFKYIWIYAIVLPLDCINKIIDVISNQVERLLGFIVVCAKAVIDLVIGVTSTLDFDNDTGNNVSILKINAFDNLLNKITSNLLGQLRTIENKYFKSHKTYAYLVNKSGAHSRDHTMYIEKPDSNKYSWLGLVVTKSYKYMLMLFMVMMQFTLKLIGDGLELASKKMLILKEYLDIFEDDLIDMHEVFCRKTSTQESWVMPWVNFLVFLPNLILDVLTCLVDFLGDIYNAAIILLKAPIITCQQFIFAVSLIGDDYIASDELCPGNNENEEIYQYSAFESDQLLDQIGYEKAEEIDLSIIRR